jgi:hypothetical protein
MTTPVLDDETVAPAAALAMAKYALATRHAECFWFWNPHAELKTVGDVNLVIRALRQSGSRAAWEQAYQIEQCL